jgi:hypothetical protein
MRSFWVLSAALFGTAAPAASKVILQADNDRTKYRVDPAQFDLPWRPPKLLSGEDLSKEKLTDTSVIQVAEAREKYPLLMNLLYPFEWELNFDGPTLCAFCRSRWWISYFVSTLYLIGLWRGTSMMKDKKPYGLKTALAMWNLFLAVFSFIGASRTAPHLLFMLKDYGFEYSVCRAAVVGYGSGPVGFWVALFIFSKYVELLDTVLLVVRKRKVGFLHWYHHCSVLLYCWHSYVWEMPTGIYFVVMNYIVHAIMYFYYFLAAVCEKPPKWALLVTILQLAQMAVGIAITLSHVYILMNGTMPNCDGHIPNLTAALGMYASYFILFAQFLANRYCRRTNGHSHNGETKKKLSGKSL